MSLERLANFRNIPKEYNGAEVVRLRNVHKTYLLGIEGVAALRGVDVSIKENEFICIYGTSGSGKTTMLNISKTLFKKKKKKWEQLINQQKENCTFIKIRLRALLLIKC